MGAKDNAYGWGGNISGEVGDGTTVSKSSPVTILGGSGWLQIAANSSNNSATKISAGIKQDGTLWTWGINNGIGANGSLGDGTTISKSSPVQISGGGTWKVVRTGTLVAGGIKQDGTFWTWGDGVNGALGNNSSIDRSSPVSVVGGITDWKDCDVGDYHWLVLRNNKELWSWGRNVEGQLGDGTTVSKSSPVTIAGGGEWLSVAAGEACSAAVKSDGTLWTWGSNVSGQLGDGTTVNKSSPVTIAGGGTNWATVSCATQTVGALTTSGELWMWGRNGGNNTQLGGATALSRISSPVSLSHGTWSEVFVGNSHCLGLKGKKLYAWGGGTNGRLGDGTTVNKSVPVLISDSINWKTASAGDHSLAIEETGSDIGFTNKDFNLETKYVTRGYLEDAVGSLIGNSNMLFGCGLGSAGRLGTGVNTNTSSPVSVLGGVGWIDVAAAGEGAAFGLKSDGTLWAWGVGDLGHLGDGTTLTRSSPVTVVGALSWRALAAGKFAAYGITTDGQLWSWGGGSDGALGNNSTANRSSPGTVSGGGTTWKQVSSTVAGQVVGAIKTDGTLWMWGRNVEGQLGDGTTVNKSSPITVAGGGNTWKQVSAGSASAGAVKTDGSLWTWGQGTNGQTGRNTTANVSSPTTIAGGGYDWKFVSFNFRNNGAIKVDGSLWMWGKNESGGLGDGTTVNKSSPVTVAGGGYSWRWLSVGNYILNGDVASAVKSDGTLWTWGYNADGQLADGTTINKSSPVSVITTDWIRWSRSSNTDYYMFAMTETDAITLFKR